MRLYKIKASAHPKKPMSQVNRWSIGWEKNWCSHYENQCGASQKLKVKPLSVPTISLLTPGQKKKNQETTTTEIRVHPCLLLLFFFYNRRG